jgi:hypothetical protein
MPHKYNITCYRKLTRKETRSDNSMLRRRICEIDRLTLRSLKVFSGYQTGAEIQIGETINDGTNDLGKVIAIRRKIDEPNTNLEVAVLVEDLKIAEKIQTTKIDV